MPKKPAKPERRPSPRGRQDDALNRDVEPPKGAPFVDRLMPGLIVPVKPVRRRKPRKFTPETAGMICMAMRTGAGFARACAVVGISEETGHQWLKRGKQEPEGSPYNNFAREVIAIRAELLAAAERGIWNAAIKGDVHAQKWLLMTQLPKEYGTTDLTEAQKLRANQELLDALNLVMDPTAFREVVRAMSKLQGSGESA
jgi:hypothetical protein